MNNKLRHIGLLFADLFGIWLLWIGYGKIKRTLIQINNQVDIIRLGNRDGFFIVGIGILMLHLLMIIEQLCPDFIKKIEKYKKPVNLGVMGFVFALLIGGCVGSSLIQSRVENAGYVHCWYVSEPSALAKTLVYTRENEICEKLVAEARAKRKRN